MTKITMKLRLIMTSTTNLVSLLIQIKLLLLLKSNLPSEVSEQEREFKESGMSVV
jgi:hypothetical protein